jgi:putative FmdB family regulatory protein
MPLFEYQCRDCGKPFEAFVTTERTPACPACEGTNLTKLLSRLGMVGAASAPRMDGCQQPAAPMCGSGRCGCAH